MASANLRFARGSIEHVDKIYRCFVDCGWAYSKGEIYRFVSLASNVSVCWDDCEDKVTGVGLVTSFSADNGILDLVGMMISHPDYRRRGIAKHIFADLTATSRKQGHDLGLIATDIGAKVYEKQDFTVPPQAMRKKYQHNSVDLHQRLREYDLNLNGRLFEESDLETVLKLDRRAFGADRRAVLSAMASGTEDGTTSARVITYLDESGCATGFAVMSYTHSSMVLGPVVANSPDETVGMMAELLQQRDGRDENENKSVSMFLSGQESSLEPVLQALGFEHLATLTAMELKNLHSPSSALLDAGGLAATYVCCANPAWG